MYFSCHSIAIEFNVLSKMYLTILYMSHVSSRLKKYLVNIVVQVRVRYSTLSVQNDSLECRLQLCEIWTIKKMTDAKRKNIITCSTDEKHVQNCCVILRTSWTFGKKLNLPHNMMPFDI